jgi:hypothetical protein
MPSIHTESLTPRVRALVAADTYATPAVGSLTSAEMEQLKAAATNYGPVAGPLSAQRAISVLSAIASPDVAIPVLEQVASNHAAPRTNRIAALRGLGRIATPQARDLLLKYVPDADPRLQQAALAALGLFADQSALATLERLREAGDLAARRQLSLTRALIAHRYGLDGPFLPERQRIPRSPTATERMHTVTMARKTIDATAADQARLRGSTYGIRLAEHAYELRCGRAEWTMFVNRDLGSSITANGRLFERPWIAALLARWLPPGIAATTQYLVLTRPTGQAIRIDVVRTDGEVVYTGSAGADGSALSFAVGDVDRPGTAPTSLVGRFDADRVRLDVAIVFDKRVGVRRTRPVSSTDGPSRPD